MLFSLPVVLGLIILLVYRPNQFVKVLSIGFVFLAAYYIYTEFIFIPHHERFIDEKSLIIVREERGFPRYAEDAENYYSLYGIHYYSVKKTEAVKCEGFDQFYEFSWCQSFPDLIKCYPTDSKCPNKSIINF